MSLLRASEEGGVLRLAIDRPAERNALSLELMREIRAALHGLEGRAVRVVIFSGGTKVFSAGADFSDLKGTAQDIAFDDSVSETVAVVRATPALVIAAIEGACIGAALELALACDVRVASETAFFQLPALRLGILYNPAALKRMRSILPGQTVAKLVLLGERIEGRDAIGAGIASHWVPAGEAEKFAATLAARTASFPRRALAAAKGCLYALDDDGTDLAQWMQLRKELLGSEERREALARAREKRGS